MLNIFNTLAGRKEPFHPCVPGRVSMYVCGVTVYDYSHLGHARSALVFDIIRRYLSFLGFQVTYVRNFTDVDDKIIHRARQEGATTQAVAEKYIQVYREDMARLGIDPADSEPRATDHMADIIDMTQRLMKKGHAYQVEGDIYFEVETFPSYGCLSKRKPEDLLAGARIEVDVRKRNPMDFALWKSSKPGEPAWESPWGEGRPGWHIECSAMSVRHLGETFDIHGGGQDLIFPHHENEIAQSCAATGQGFARWWIHNGFVQVNQEKLSKSLGNFFTIREIFAQCPTRQEVTREALRYCLLATHYRSPLDFSDQSLNESKRALDGCYDLFQRLEETSDEEGAGDQDLDTSVERLREEFRKAMDDDFNTAGAIACLQHFRGEVNKYVTTGLSRAARRKAKDTFQVYGNVIGLFQLPWQTWEMNPRHPITTTVESGGQKHDTTLSRAPVRGEELSDESLEQLVAERLEARRKKDFGQADAIRTHLASLGITLEDRPDGTTRWKR